MPGTLRPGRAALVISCISRCCDHNPLPRRIQQQHQKFQPASQYPWSQRPRWVNRLLVSRAMIPFKTFQGLRNRPELVSRTTPTNCEVARVSPPVGDTPTVGETSDNLLGSPVPPTRKAPLSAIAEAHACDFAISADDSHPPAEVESTTEADRPSVGYTPTVGATRAPGFRRLGPQSSTALNPGGVKAEGHYYPTGAPPKASPRRPPRDTSGGWTRLGLVMKVSESSAWSLPNTRCRWGGASTTKHSGPWPRVMASSLRQRSRRPSRLDMIGSHRLVRLNEKSVRVLLPKLISKKILEVVAAENSATRLGRTYRIFNYEEILERQRAANLLNIVKNGRAVEFVSGPEATTVGETPTQHEGRGALSINATRDHMDGAQPVGDRHTVGETPRVQKNQQGEGLPLGAQVPRTGKTPAELVSKVQAIIRSFDDDAIRTLWAKCVQQAPDCTAEEVEYCLRLKANQLLTKGKSVTNPVGLMLWAVPKCFEGPAALHLAFREQRRAEEAARQRADEQLRLQRVKRGIPKVAR